jgi:hypothetical protein
MGAQAARRRGDRRRTCACADPAAGFSVRRIVRERQLAESAWLAARAERATAVRQWETAERLVQFAVGQLRGRLEPLGKPQ